jgi:hypothetical protein
MWLCRRAPGYALKFVSVGKLIHMSMAVTSAPGCLPQIRVFCRLRPAASSSAACSADGVSLALTADDGRRHSFAFDKVGSTLHTFAHVWTVDLASRPVHSLDSLRQPVRKGSLV